MAASASEIHIPTSEDISQTTKAQGGTMSKGSKGAELQSKQALEHNALNVDAALQAKIDHDEHITKEEANNAVRKERRAGVGPHPGSIAAKAQSIAAKESNVNDQGSTGGAVKQAPVTDTKSSSLPSLGSKDHDTPAITDAIVENQRKATDGTNDNVKIAIDDTKQELDKHKEAVEKAETKLAATKLAQDQIEQTKSDVEKVSGQTKI